MNQPPQEKKTEPREFWICPEEFDTETGTWLGCDVKTHKPDDPLLPFNHVIERAALVVESEKVKMLEQRMLEQNYKWEALEVDYRKQVKQLKEKLEAAEKLAQAQAEKLHVFQCAIDEVFNNKHLRNNSLLTSNPPQNGGVWDLRNAVTQLLKASK